MRGRFSDGCYEACVDFIKADAVHGGRRRLANNKTNNEASHLAACGAAAAAAAAHRPLRPAHKQLHRLVSAPTAPHWDSFRSKTAAENAFIDALQSDGGRI